jgi:hypothetical protein
MDLSRSFPWHGTLLAKQLGPAEEATFVKDLFSFAKVFEQSFWPSIFLNSKNYRCSNRWLPQ